MGAPARAPFGALLLFIAGLGLRPVDETDLFFRIARGRVILDSGGVPRTNLFSFTAPDAPYDDPAWLFDAAVAALERVGGFPLIVVAKTAVVVAAFAVAYVVSRRRGASAVAAVATLAAAAWLGRERFVERPHVWSWLGEALVLLLLAGPVRRRALVVPLVAMWVNLHAGAFVAPLIVGATAVGAMAERDRASAWRLAAIAAAAAAALLASPFGVRVWAYLFFHGDIHALHPVDEFRSAAWPWDASLIVAVLVTALVVALPGRPPLRASLPVLVLALLALRSIRFAADFALLAAPLVAARLSSFVPRVHSVRSGAALAAGLLVATLPPRLASAGPFLSLELDRSSLPVDALAFVERHGLRARMYNDPDIGGFLAYEGYPRVRVFSDGRLPAYPRAMHALLGRHDHDQAAWDAAMRAYGVTTALVSWAGINPRVAFWDPAQWALVYRAHDARVFVRRSPEHAAVIAAFEIPATFSWTESAGAVTLPLDEPPPASVVPRCAWKLRLSDLLFELDGGDDARALAATRDALALPDCPRDLRTRAAAWAGARLVDREPCTAAQYLAEDADVTSVANRALAHERCGDAASARSAWLEVAARGTPAIAAAARARAARLTGAR